MEYTASQCGQFCRLVQWRSSGVCDTRWFGYCDTSVCRCDLDSLEQSFHHHHHHHHHHPAATSPLPSLSALLTAPPSGSPTASLSGSPTMMALIPNGATPALVDTIYIKTQVFRLLRYYSPAPRNIARSDWATQNITHNMTSSKT